MRSAPSTVFTDKQLEPITGPELNTWWASSVVTESGNTILQACVKVRQGSAGGSGVMIGRAVDHKVIVASAAHIFSSLGQVSISFGGGTYQGRVFDLDRKTDVALLWADVPVNVNVVTTYVSPVQPVPGSTTIKIGFPAYAKGQPNIRTGKVLAPRGSFLFNAELYVRPGDSGGGVFAEDGTLVSIVSGYTSGDVLWGSGTNALAKMLESHGWGCSIFRKHQRNPPQTQPPLPPSKPPSLPQPPKPLPDEPIVLPTPGDPDLRKILIEIESLRVEIAKIKPIPGPKGDLGPVGPQGPPGPKGDTGKDGDAVDTVKLQAELDKLRNQKYIAELLDEKGAVKQRVTFGADQPLRIKLVPLPPKTEGK